MAFDHVHPGSVVVVVVFEYLVCGSLRRMKWWEGRTYGGRAWALASAFT